MAIDDDPSPGYVIESRYKIHQRRLPCPAGTHDRHDFATANRKGDSIEDRHAGFIFEMNILEFNAIGKAVELLQAGVSLRIQRQNLPDPSRSAQGLLKGIIDAAHPPNRIIEFDQHDDERDEHARTHRSRPRIKQKRRDDKDSKDFHERR